MALLSAGSGSSSTTTSSTRVVLLVLVVLLARTFPPHGWGLRRLALPAAFPLRRARRGPRPWGIPGI
eukprot:3085817-Rhodomonas_salina.1